MPADREPPFPATSAAPVVNIFTRQPVEAKETPAHDRAAYLRASVEVEQLVQDLRYLEAAVEAALSDLAAREPQARRARDIRMINAKSAEQFEVLLRVLGTLDSSRAEPATPPADDPRP